MSTAANPITEQPTTQQENRERKPGEKLSASEEILRLKRQNRELERGGKKSAEERIGALIAKIRSLEEEHEFLRQHNDELLNKLAAYEISAPEEQAVWHQLEALRSSVPALDEALRILGNIPEPFKREIARMPNPGGFCIFLAGAVDFLEYIRDLRPDAAVRRLRKAGYDAHPRLPQLHQGGK